MIYSTFNGYQRDRKARSGATADGDFGASIISRSICDLFFAPAIIDLLLFVYPYTQIRCQHHHIGLCLEQASTLLHLIFIIS